MKTQTRRRLRKTYKGKTYKGKTYDRPLYKNRSKKLHTKKRRGGFWPFDSVADNDLAELGHPETDLERKKREERERLEKQKKIATGTQEPFYTGL